MPKKPAQKTNPTENQTVNYSNVRIHQQPRKSMVLKVTPVGVVVFIPKWLKKDNPQVRAFIEEGLKRLNKTARPTPPAERSADEVRTLVNTWAAKMEVEPGRIQFRVMYRKWGSCSTKGNITFSTALYWLPLHLVEYVICHELVHLRIFSHGKEFQEMMSRYLPPWREYEKELDRWLQEQYS